MSLLRFTIILVIAYALSACSKDDEDVIIIPADFDALEVEFDYSDYHFTALKETIVFETDLSYTGETPTDPAIIEWYLDDLLIKKDEGSFNESYSVSLSDVSIDFHDLKLVIKGTDNQKIEKSIIFNHRPYVNFEHLSIGQKSTFLYYEDFVECNDFDIEPREIFWEVIDSNGEMAIREIGGIYGEPILNLSTLDGQLYFDIDFDNVSSIIYGAYFFSYPFKIEIQNEVVYDDEFEDCLIGEGGSYKKFTFLKKDILNCTVNDLRGSGYDFSYALNEYQEFVATSFLLTEFTYEQNASIRADL